MRNYRQAFMNLMWYEKAVALLVVALAVAAASGLPLTKALMVNQSSYACDQQVDFTGTYTRVNGIGLDSNRVNDLNTKYGNWNTAYSKVNTDSGNWDSTHTKVDADSGKWDAAYAKVNTDSGGWDAAYAKVNTDSGGWDATHVKVDADSGKWDAAYSKIDSDSAQWAAGYAYSQATHVSDSPRYYAAATEPDVDTDRYAFWKDTGTDSMYIVIDINGTQKKLELQ